MLMNDDLSGTFLLQPSSIRLMLHTNQQSSYTHSLGYEYDTPVK